jgi:hypothetical protein
MYDVSQLKEAAIAEILHPTLAMTNQILDDHPLDYKDGTPNISSIDKEDTNGIVRVYFKFKDEPFDLVIYISSIPNIEILSVAIEPGTSVYLWIEKPESNVQIDIPFVPTRTTIKGFEFGPDKNYSNIPEHKINRLLNILDKYKERIKEIASITYVSLNIAYHSHKDNMQGIHLDRAMLKRISELNIELDLDLYASGTTLK